MSKEVDWRPIEETEYRPLGAIASGVIWAFLTVALIFASFFGWCYMLECPHPLDIRW